MKSTKVQTLSAGHALVYAERCLAIAGSENTRHYLELMANTCNGQWD